MKNKKIIAIIIAAVIVVLAVIGIVVLVNNNNSTTTNTADENKVAPTFMYFVSKSDATYEEEMKAVEDLKEKYNGKVVFDVKDVDEDPDSLKSFPMVEGNTPFLIMLDTNNDLCAFEPSISDKKELAKVIDGALEK